MAIFHLNTRTSRYPKAGRIVNSIDHYNYITCQERYSKNKNLVYIETGRLPNCDKIKTIKDFWKAADQYKRKNGRTYRDVTMALQEEFTIEENIAFVHKFFDHFKIRENQVYVLTIHDKQVPNNKSHRNIYCEIMFNERIITARKFEHANEVFRQWAGPIKQNEKGGLQVDPYFQSRKFINDMRNYWEQINNEKFKELGLEIQISSKSL